MLNSRSVFVFAATYRVDVRWYKNFTDSLGQVQEQAVYEWHEHYNGKLGFGDQ